MAEWLGTGLQNRLRRFESARNLNKKSETLEFRFFCLSKSKFSAFQEKFAAIIEVLEDKPNEIYKIDTIQKGSSDYEKSYKITFKPKY